MRKAQIQVIIFLLLASAGIASARKFNPEVVLPQLQQKLTQATTSKDSVAILYDIYDMSPRKDQVAVGQKLYEVAGRAKDENAQLDIVRLNSNLYRTDDQFVRLQKLIRTLPRSPEQRETELFLQLRRLSFSTRRMDTTAHKQIAAIINKLNLTPAGKMSNTDRLLSLYTVAAYMRNVPDSKLLDQYVDSLVHMVNSSNYRLYALRNIIYSEAANIYSDAGQTKKAVEADRKLLELISGLEKKYAGSGRKYRDYDVSRFIVYRRMLRNYKSLTPAEVDKYYNSIQELARTNSDVAADLEKNPSPHAYYLMAKGHYAEALPILQQAVRTDRAFPVMRQLHGMLQKAARETGDSVALMSSLAAMNRLNEQLEDDNLSDRYRELQVAYEVNALKAAEYEKRVELAESETARLRSNFSYNMLIWLLFACLVIILLFYWSRYRSNIARLRHMADMMSEQRDRLKADKFNEYNLAPYRDKSTRVETNDTRELIKSIMTSVLYTATLGHHERDKHIKEDSVSAILNQTAVGIRPLLNPGTNLEITDPVPDFDIKTDVDCLTYLLQRVIVFAQNSSKNGTVTLTAKHVGDSSNMQFIFTHTGPRIPMGREESLFDYIIDIDDLSHRDDSTMLICRLVALLLHCTIAYNPHVDGPAKLIVNIPMRIDS